MEEEYSTAYPLREWMIRDNNEYPTLSIVSFLVDPGAFSLLLNKEMLLELSEAFAKEAERLPYKTDQN